MNAAPSLRRVSSERIERVLREIEGGHLACPLRTLALQAIGLADVAEALVAATAELERTAVTRLLACVLQERMDTAPHGVEIVWTGPQPRGSYVRRTGVVMRELFESAQQSILIAGFRFDHGAELFEPLHRVMVERGVVVRLFVDVEHRRRFAAPVARAKSQGGDNDQTDTEAARSLDHFLHRNWTFGPPRPLIFFDPRTARAHAPGEGRSMHAKCVVVDDRIALVGSANFTRRAQERNYELGVLLDDTDVAKRIVAQWNGLASDGTFIRHV